MNYKKILLSGGATMAAISLPLTVVACTKLTKKQREVKAKYNELVKIYEKKGGVVPEKEKYTDEQIAKMNDTECDIAIAALAVLIEAAKILPNKPGK
ncbi:hypothetical protein [Mycoplasmopsis primatum]|uniref:hypothetical protein n=1 Tax=Mycoplasmopsis primatum TaxID=55604 RepID=UPI000494E2D1|nr:hypothetical protein [Mycoplasmopsis primatum]